VVSSLNVAVHATKHPEGIWKLSHLSRSNPTI
jgi:hypothetical protein